MKIRWLIVTFLLPLIMLNVVTGQCQNDSCSWKEVKSRIEKLEKNSQAIKVSGQIFGAYSYSRFGTNGNDFNKFDLDRSYITVRSGLGDGWTAQLTTDLYRGSETNPYYKGFGVRMKFAYLEYIQGEWNFRFGLIPGLFHAIEEAAWKYRGIAQTPTDRYGYFATADLGISATYTLPEKYGDFSLGILNGKGFTNPESDKYKDVILRTTITPFPTDKNFKTLSLSGFTYLGYENGQRYSGLPKNRYGLLAYYSYDILSAGIEYITRTDAPSHPDTTATGSVVSFVSEILSPWEQFSKYSLILRYDQIDPNTSTPHDGYSFIVVGIVYKPNSKVALSLNIQETFAESKTLRRTTGGFVDYDERIYCHMIVNLP
ncbi:MAG: hypothetical protein N3A63_02575 [Bacteroidetes bacterium]|nr:hypothetical protein [Bacteroidota bacterium]